MNFLFIKFELVSQRKVLYEACHEKGHINVPTKQIQSFARNLGSKMVNSKTAKDRCAETCASACFTNTHG